jgi:hypothetical protein
MMLLFHPHRERTYGYLQRLHILWKLDYDFFPSYVVAFHPWHPQFSSSFVMEIMHTPFHLFISVILPFFSGECGLAACTLQLCAVVEIVPFNEIHTQRSRATTNPFPSRQSLKTLNELNKQTKKKKKTRTLKKPIVRIRDQNINTRAESIECWRGNDTQREGGVCERERRERETRREQESRQNVSEKVEETKD